MNQTPSLSLIEDPELFSILLSLLRTGNLPSKAKHFDIQDIIFEARFYGISDLLVETPLFDSLLALSHNVVAAGATDFSGLQILDLDLGFVTQTLKWENATKSSSTVQAIGMSPDLLFTSFESGRRNSNTIMVYDVNSFKVVSEIARNEIFGADLDSAIPSTKLCWVSSLNLLMASGSHSSHSGKSTTMGRKSKRGLVARLKLMGIKFFVCKQEKLELWSEVLMGSSNDGKDRIFRKNVLGRVKDWVGKRITNMGFGGNKMFVTRKDEQCVEVWQSSVRRL
ncbi:putative chromatin remodeling & transcription regulator BTB-POZ family [Helianthus annuus]|nr:putative chromatin remodeling & transcription regulator BTB-POZ family [Helianthus annuus]